MNLYNVLDCLSLRFGWKAAAMLVYGLFFRGFVFRFLFFYAVHTKSLYIEEHKLMVAISIGRTD